MTDHVATYLDASVRADTEALLGCLAADARLISPLVGGAVFTGEHDLRILLAAVYSSLAGLRWTERISQGRVHVIVGEARVLGRELTDAMILETDQQGRVLTIRPHLRPWTGLTAFAIALLPRLARHPGVIARSTRRADAGA